MLFRQQTLRGYGAGRFVDNNLFDVNVEMRSRVWETDIFNTHGILELAPFFDVGRVFHNPGEDFVTDLASGGRDGLSSDCRALRGGLRRCGLGRRGCSGFFGNQLSLLARSNPLGCVPRETAMEARRNNGASQKSGTDHVAPDCRGMNFYRADDAFRGLLNLYLEPALRAHLEPHLDRLGELAGGRLDELADAADKASPRASSARSLRPRRGSD